MGKRHGEDFEREAVRSLGLIVVDVYQDAGVQAGKDAGCRYGANSFQSEKGGSAA